MSDTFENFPDSQEFINSKGRVIFQYSKNNYGSYDFNADDSIFGSDQPESIMACLMNTKFHNPSLRSRNKDFVASFQKRDGDYWHFPVNDFRCVNTPVLTAVV